MAAYLVGCNIKNAAPKQAENVAVGSFTPSTVPATYVIITVLRHKSLQYISKFCTVCEYGHQKASIKFCNEKYIDNEIHTRAV